MRRDPNATGQELRRAVLAEDEEMLRAILAEALEYSGFLVGAAGNGLEALALIEPGTDLLVSDIKMPVMSGYRLVEAAMKLKPGLQVLLMTGHAPENIPPSLRQYQIEVLQKPFDLDQFSMMARKLAGLPARL